MSVTVTYTQQDVDTLKAAIASGTLSVRFGGPPERFQQFQDLTEMRKTLADIVAQTNTAAGTRRGVRIATFKKGV